MGENPRDLAAIQADDALLDAIGRGAAVEEDELIRELVGWRREIHAVPIPELVDPVTALATVRAGRLPWRYRVLLRLLGWFTRTPR